ncbi:taste receptor, type 2, member 201, tandem duplicate 1 [Misgurnus anguillicaudatus]|uniref:taste receptor, type 2, member 201, tandem duplicate 1 n=1 Tax=Misgurnus anguillicaudatus TaxID=75329 RepID=UPI003CCF4E53
MSSYDIEMGPLAYAIVNVLISVTTILINIFFICCMFTSQERPENQQKPPLNVLLGSLIGCNLIINIVNLLYVMYDTVDVSLWVFVVSSAATLYTMRTSFTASLGLNVFYYFQIVPTRRPFLIWVKMHIKLLMYLMLFFENIFFLFGFILRVLPRRVFIPQVDFNSSSVALNVTSEGLRVRHYLIMTDIGLRCIYSFVGIGIMVASNTSTVLYLWRHVRRMEDSSSSSALHYQMQKRVTIMSIIQTLLFFFYSAWLMSDEIMFRFNVFYFDPSGNILYSVVGFYSFGTTIILGVGQTKFRVRAVEIGEKLVRLSHKVT